MSAVYIPEPLTAPELWYPKRKPLANVKINRDTPAARGLISALLFNEYGGLPRNILNGLEVDEFGEAGSWSPQGYRIALNGGLQMNNPQPALTIDDNYLWHVDVIFHAGGANSVLMGNRYDGQASPLNFFKISSRAVEFYSTQVSKIDHPADLVPGERYAITVFKRANILEVYFNGTFHNSITNNRTLAANPVYLGGGENAEAPREATEITVICAFHGYFNGDAGSFNLNPYQILEAA